MNRKSTNSRSLSAKKEKQASAYIEISSSESSSEDSESSNASITSESSSSDVDLSDASSDELDAEETSRFAQQEDNLLFFQSPVYLAVAVGYPAWPARACSPNECAYFSDEGRKSKAGKVATSWLSVPEGHAGALWLEKTHISSVTRENILKSATNRTMRNPQYCTEGFPNAWKEAFRLMQYQEDLSVAVSAKFGAKLVLDTPLLFSLWQSCETKTGLGIARRMMATVSLEAAGHVSSRKECADAFENDEPAKFPLSGVACQICVLCGGSLFSGPFVAKQGCVRCHRSVHEHCCDILKLSLRQRDNIRNSSQSKKESDDDSPCEYVEPISPSLPLFSLLLRLRNAKLLDDDSKQCFICRLELDDPYKLRMNKLKSLHADSKLELYLQNVESETDEEYERRAKKKKKSNGMSCLNSKVFDPLFMAFSDHELTDYSDVDSETESAWISDVMNRYLIEEEKEIKEPNPTNLALVSQSAQSTSSCSSLVNPLAISSGSKLNHEPVLDSVSPSVQKLRNIPQAKTSAGGLLAYALNQSSQLMEEDDFRQSLLKHWHCSNCFSKNVRSCSRCAECSVGMKPESDDISPLNTSLLSRIWEKNIKKHYPIMDRAAARSDMKSSHSTGGVTDEDFIAARKRAYLSLIADDSDIIEACGTEKIDSDGCRPNKHKISNGTHKSKRPRKSSCDEVEAEEKLENAAHAIRDLERDSTVKSFQISALRKELKNSLICLHKAKLECDEKQNTHSNSKSRLSHLSRLNARLSSELELKDEELKQGLWEEGIPYGWPKDIQARVQSAVTYRCVRLFYSKNNVFRSVKVMRNPKIEIRKITNSKHPAYKSPKDDDDDTNPSKNMGYGVFVRPGFSIKKGERIVTYGGEIEMRKVVEKRIPHNDYCMTLEDCDNVSCDFVIDASRCGNEARFVNDCRGVHREFNCSPIVHHDETGLPRVFLIAVKDIHEEEELLLNYGDQYWSSVKKRLVHGQESNSGSEGDDEDSDDDDD